MKRASVAEQRSVTFLSEDSVHLRGSYASARSERALSLVLVHDYGGDRSCWDPYVPLFRTRGWNVLTFDLRLPVWPFFLVAWIGDVSAVLLIAVRTYRLIFHPELLGGKYQIKPVE